MSASAPRMSGRDRFIRLCLTAMLVPALWLMMQRMAGRAPAPLAQEINLALQQMQKGDKAGAKTTLDKYVAAHRDEPAAYQQAYTVSQAADEWEWARDYALQGVKSSKAGSKEDQVQLYTMLAQAYTHLEAVPNQHEAIAAAQKAYALSPDDPMILNQLGYVLADNGQRLDEAKTYLTQALHLIRDQPDSFETQLLKANTEDSYGWLLYRQGDAASAATILAQAIIDIPDPSVMGRDMREFHYHLGAAYRKAGRIEEARAALITALRYDPNFAPARAEYSELPPPPATPAPPARSTHAPASPAAKPAPAKPAAAPDATTA